MGLIISYLLVRLFPHRICAVIAAEQVFTAADQFPKDV